MKTTAPRSALLMLHQMHDGRDTGRGQEMTAASRVHPSPAISLGRAARRWCCSARSFRRPRGRGACSGGGCAGRCTDQGVEPTAGAGFQIGRVQVVRAVPDKPDDFRFKGSSGTGGDEYVPYHGEVFGCQAG